MEVPKTSFAMVQTANRLLEPQDPPIPDIDEDSALLRLEACGICGSDYEQFEGMLRTPVPVVPGHEPLGSGGSGRRTRRLDAVCAGDVHGDGAGDVHRQGLSARRGM